MAIFNLGSAGNIQDLKQVKSYLYKLEEQLKYMFSNLDPEENYNERAKLIFAANAERQAALEVALEGLSASYITKESFAQMALTKDEAAITYATQDTMSKLELTVDGIEASYVTKTGVAAAINLNQQGVKIQGTKISLEGTVTANSYFKINTDGSMEATNGKFSGELVAATGKFSGKLQAATGTFAGSLSAATGTFAGALSAATGTFSGNLSAAGGTFSGDISGASGTFSGTVRGGTIAVGGNSVANAPFKVDSSGNLWAGGVGSNAPFQVSNTGTVTITGSIKTKGTGANYPFMKLSNGIWEGGRYYNGTETVGGRIVFEDSITKKDPVTHQDSSISAMSLESDGTILCGGVFTAFPSQMSGNTPVYQGITRAGTNGVPVNPGNDGSGALISVCYDLNGDFDDQEGWIEFYELEMQFANGLLISCAKKGPYTRQIW